MITTITGSLPQNVVIQFPSGQWGFVGKVRTDLAYVSKDGKPLTTKQIDNTQKFGPRLAGVKTRSFDTKKEALAAI